MLKGIDVARFQGNIDWDKVKSQIDFAILKFGNINDVDPLYIDTNFERNYNECRRLGIPVGIYVYNYCNKVENLQRETNKLVKLLEGKEFPVGVYLDMEDGTIQPESKDNLTKQVNYFYSILTEAGHKAGLYTSLFWARNEYNIEELNPNILIWIAQYYKECTYERHFDMWQYTSKGQIEGINANVDMDICYFDIEKPNPIKPVELEGTTLDLVYRTMQGEFGDRETRKNNLGSRYDEVQDFINHIYNSDISTLVKETKEGQYGNDNTRKVVLNTKYDEVQATINKEYEIKKYRVRKGDTLSSIANKFNTSVDKIVSANNISNPNLIYPNQILEIR